MTVAIERIEPIEKALVRLREAPLEAADEERILIYRNATIRIADFFPSELNPTSFYVLRDKLEFQRQLRADFLDRYQIDILRLSDVLHIKTAEGLIGMAPPFVEIYEETVRIIPKEGDRLPPPESKILIPILKDGIHRAWIANEEKLPLRCIVVHGALPDYLPYVYPNGWSDIKICDAAPKEKKLYRRQEQYTFMYESVESIAANER